jgi:hypothetical protein
MDALRARLGPVVEWAIAAAFLAATVAVVSLILQEFRVSRLHLPEPVARIESEPAPAAVPPRAVSVPVLPFRDGKEIRVGDTAAAVAARLGRSAESGRQEVDRGRLGERITRYYEYAGFRFILVFEPFERNGEPRVGAIYLP